MAIIRRTESVPTPRRADVDAFHLMQRLLDWDPLSGVDPFRAMAPLGQTRSYLPAFDVKETRDGFTFTADLPGVSEADLDIAIAGTLLTVSGKRDPEPREEGDTWYAAERSHGAFSRSFTLPESADTEHVRAELHGGVLKLALPKKPEMQPRKVPVSVHRDGSKH